MKVNTKNETGKAQVTACSFENFGDEDSYYWECILTLSDGRMVAGHASTKEQAQAKARELI